MHNITASALKITIINLLLETTVGQLVTLYQLTMDTDLVQTIVILMVTIQLNAPRSMMEGGGSILSVLMDTSMAHTQRMEL